MSNHNTNQKNTLLYIVIAILSISLIAISALNFLSITTVSSMKNRITEMQKSIDTITSQYEDVKTQATELETLKNDQDALLTTLQTKVDELSAAAENATAAQTESNTAEATTAPVEVDAVPVPADDILPVLMPQLQSMFPTGNGNWSVYVGNLAKNSSDSINSDRMQAASLIKLYIMGAVYENYNALSATYGSETLNSQLHPMITVSDNDAANALVSYLGGGDSAKGMEAVNNYCSAHGYNDTHMGRLLLYPNDVDDNYTSVADCGKFLSDLKLAVDGKTTLDHASDMFELMKQQQRTHKIPAGIPEGVGTANKTGELADVENDAAIIFNTATGEDLIICFMSDSLNAPGSAQSSISDMAYFIYKNYNP